MSREDALLREYETCQTEISSRAAQFWVSLSIIISVNLILLTQAGYAIIKSNVATSGYANLLVVFVLAGTMFFINVVFKKWQSRQHYITQVIYQRMRKIEDVTGMHRNWLIHGLDLKNDPNKSEEWKKLPKSRKDFIERLIASYPCLPKFKRPHGDKVFGHVLLILIILWFLLILLVFLIYFWPAFRVWLVN